MKTILFDKSWQRSAMLDAACTVMHHDANPKMRSTGEYIWARRCCIDELSLKKDLTKCIQIFYSAINLFRFTASQPHEDFNRRRVTQYEKTLKALLKQAT